ncbi:RdlA protein [Streptomyces sp. ISL-36]|uniref:RdlA protein n=1 Tax=Streptomyces sp. ISL-36 TaxID=2819182 RepID=UPI001BE76871|nr:RdlA protein [Streptomyces sp. ISL-36]MBT2444175.1 RdlA protein [Streptomyces sp. ISL-36]
MIKKVLATAAVAASVVGMSAATASASGEDANTANLIGNKSQQSIGSSHVDGHNFGLVNGGILHCFDVQDVTVQVPIVGVAVDDILSPKQNQTCTQNSVEQMQNNPLKDLIAVLADNGTDIS